MKKFTIEELMFAKELCFFDNFKKLMEKHSKGTPIAEYWQAECNTFKYSAKLNLLSYINIHSRADLKREQFGEVLDNIINELISG